MSEFLDRMKQTAKADKRTIVLPEGEDERTRVAARQIIEEGLANLVILGDPEEIDVPEATVIDPKTSSNHEVYAQELQKLRAKKGMTLEQARELVDDATYFGTLMVKMGDADGLVSGACHSTANTLRPALQILKTAPGTKLVSSFMIMDVPHCAHGADGILLFADIGLNEYPDADGLSEIAISSNDSWKALMGSVPKVALLSYSSHGSASSEHVDKVALAAKLVHEKRPDILSDGELQLDAALIDEVAHLKAPHSEVAGDADVLIFPNLDAGNIGYKLVERLAGAQAYGPILQGIARPVNDLSRGCHASDIVAVTAITAVQAQMSD